MITFILAGVLSEQMLLPGAGCGEPIMLEFQMGSSSHSAPELLLHNWQVGGTSHNNTYFRVHQFIIRFINSGIS
jgi:hypothetical protein